MKYGKEFQQILDDPSFPPEWKESAVEYRQLKKLIKNVVNELTSMGLSPDVLHRLLLTEEDAPSGFSAAPQGDTQASSTTDDKGEVLEFEFESPEGSPATIHQSAMADGASHHAHAHEPKEVFLDPVPVPDSPELLSPRTAEGYDGQSHHRRFRLRLLSDSSARSTGTADESPAGREAVSVTTPLRPMSVAEIIAAQEREDAESVAETEVSSIFEAENGGQGGAERPAHHGRRAVRRVVDDGHGGVKAEYVLTGDASHPVPQLRLHLSTSPSPPASIDPSPSPSTESYSTTNTDTEDDDSDSQADSSTRDDETMATPKAFAVPSQYRPREMGGIPSSPTLNRLRAARSPIWAIASNSSGGSEGELQDGLRSLSLGDAAVDAGTSSEYPFPAPIPTTPQPHAGLADTTPRLTGHHERDLPATVDTTSTPDREREFIIPLASDLAFFNLLTTALTSLSTFHAKQQVLFRQSVEQLCGMISQSIQPGAEIEILPTPLSPSLDTSIGTISSPNTSKSLVRSSKPHFPSSGGGGGSRKSSKKDLYAWREIFTLWIEAEIFESTSERTRGERSLSDAQARLQNFAKEVVRRGLGDRRTMKGKKVREAWEEFLRLNVLLLDLKRFQGANINAARKILKKHDKRTALTASAGFPEFVRSTLSAPIDGEGNVSTWTFYNTSLPHVLLASLTDTLLPILPSLDDYACLICTSIAFKPIRLACSHLFCVRCLVKMQREGKESCPLCRSKVVLLADKNSLDLTVMNYMKTWFPKEVKAKQRENADEVAHEQALAAGMDTRCTIM